MARVKMQCLYPGYTSSVKLVPVWPWIDVQLTSQLCSDRGIGGTINDLLNICRLKIVRCSNVCVYAEVTLSMSVHRSSRSQQRYCTRAMVLWHKLTYIGGPVYLE